MADLKTNIYRIIGENIRNRRSDLKLSQAELSEKLNLSRATISNVEAGRHQVPIYILYEISALLGLEIHDILPKYVNIVIQEDDESNVRFLDFLKSANINKNDLTPEQLKLIRDTFNKIQ